MAASVVTSSQCNSSTYTYHIESHIERTLLHRTFVDEFASRLDSKRRGTHNVSAKEMFLSMEPNRMQEVLAHASQVHIYDPSAFVCSIWTRDMKVANERVKAARESKQGDQIKQQQQQPGEQPPPGKKKQVVLSKKKQVVLGKKKKQQSTPEEVEEEVGGSKNSVSAAEAPTTYTKDGSVFDYLVGKKVSANFYGSLSEGVVQRVNAETKTVTLYWCEEFSMSEVDFIDVYPF